MKTQINQIVNGSQFNVGTSYDVREQIAMKVFAENPQELLVKFKGEIVSLKRKWSASGKTSWYSSVQLSVDIVKALCPGDKLAISRPDRVEYILQIDEYMNCRVMTNRRRDNSKIWKSGQIIKGLNSEITIL